MVSIRSSALVLLFLLVGGSQAFADSTSLLERAEIAYQQGRWNEARQTLVRAVGIAKTPEEIRESVSRLSRLNLELLLSPSDQPETVWVKIQSGDSLSKIAKRAGTTVELLKRINRISDSSKIRVGRTLKVPIESFSVEIDISDNVADLRLGGRFFKRYPVSTGRAGNTPVGDFEITDRLIHPDWWHPLEKRMIPYGDPDHRIGSHWLGWTKKGFGMHGTDEPEKIGLPVSLGCVRFRNDDIAEVFMLLPSGTRVTVKP